MPDLLAQGAAWLAAKLHDFAARDVEYRRGGLAVTLRATLGHTKYEQADASGIVTTQESRDYLVRATDLVLGGFLVLPEVGDEIVEGAFVHVVLPLPNEEHFRFSDPYRVMLRIHTKQV